MSSKTLFGTTVVKIGDESFTLVPTLDAVRRIEARFGGLRGASQALSALSVDGTAHIIVSGANLKGDAADAVASKVWEAGVLAIAVQATPYLAALYNPRGDDQGNVEAEKESAP